MFNRLCTYYTVVMGNPFHGGSSASMSCGFPALQTNTGIWSMYCYGNSSATAVTRA